MLLFFEKKIYLFIVDRYNNPQIWSSPDDNHDEPFNLECIFFLRNFFENSISSFETRYILVVFFVFLMFGFLMLIFSFGHFDLIFLLLLLFCRWWIILGKGVEQFWSVFTMDSHHLSIVDQFFLSCLLEFFWV